MPPLNETSGVSIRLGRISIISVPIEFAPRGLDWSRWILNTAVKYQKIKFANTNRVTVLDAKGVQFEHMKGAGLEFSRRDLQSVDPITLFEDSGEGALSVSHGSWEFALSSWVDSAIRIANSIFNSELKKFHETQFAKWKALASKFVDDSEFILSDSGSKFTNASLIGKAWIERISRSRSLGENPRSGWCAAIVNTLPFEEKSNTLIEVDRFLKLKPLDWCGDPSWGQNSMASFSDRIAGIDEIWISVPGVGLALQIHSQMKMAGLSAESTLVAPSIAVGWHPIRDYFMCLGSHDINRIFVYLDYLENLHFIQIKKTVSKGALGDSL